MTILNGTNSYRELLSTYEQYFEKNCTPSFENLMWTFLMDDVHSDKDLVFTPIHHNGRLQISWCTYNEYGHRPTNVGFADGVDYDEACDIVEELNLKLFGVSYERSFITVASSMKKESYETV